MLRERDRAIDDQLLRTFEREGVYGEPKLVLVALNGPQADLAGLIHAVSVLADFRVSCR
jgi:hypothetical protein